MGVVINGRFLTQQLTGVQRFAFELSKRLILINRSIKLLTPNVPLNESYSELSTDYVVKQGYLNGQFWEQLYLPLASRNKLLLNLANTAPLFKRYQIVTVHDLAFLRYPECFSASFAKWYSFLIPRIVKNSLRVLTVSHFSREEIVNFLGVSPERITVIYNAVSEKFFYDPCVEKENIVLAVGSLDPRKNLLRLIDAFKKLNLHDYTLFIVGQQSKIFRNSKLEALIRNLSNVKITGYLTDEELVKLYQRAKLFIYPSVYEGFGLPPLEAMACGTPVIVSNVASLPEVCGDAAYYINPFSVDDIANGIRCVLEDDVLQKELISKGLKRVKRFTWENSVKKLVSVIEELGY
ncbi:glycosyl transferase group 1 [Thermovibrio ammonificans HB-1]|uniref:Glycosyl transferase group 1 n=1 Tax=Thermovibrio ammonificans (strain DSM 15698 / JCM 12110 / HB-1) TaxID=648996 RepID=E8T656_THEA1|nr:glycosyltransferase family 1 protein [Thermovibrio ammonificans]ADU96640.1 glycosyl transferase group 1 [Thermovibrio ammonificans HB-1]